MRFLVLLLVALTFASCSYRTEKEAEISGKVQGRLMGFNQLSGTILNNKCSGCHGWTTNHQAVVSRLGTIAERINTKDPGSMMPKPPLTLTPQEHASLMLWIQAGGPMDVPGDSTQPTVPPPPKPLEPGLYYAYVQQKVFEVKCSQCHGWAKTAEAANYQKVINNLEKIESRVRSEFSWEVMPPLDAKNGALSEEEKDLLFDWIKAGAPEQKTDDSDSSANEI